MTKKVRLDDLLHGCLGVKFTEYVGCQSEIKLLRTKCSSAACVPGASYAYAGDLSPCLGAQTSTGIHVKAGLWQIYFTNAKKWTKAGQMPPKVFRNNFVISCWLT